MKFLVLGIIVWIYKTWFSSVLLTAGDISSYYPLRLADFSWSPYAWSSVFGNGVGAPTFSIFYLDMYLHFGVRLFVTGLGLPWELVSKLLFFWPILVIGGVSSFALGAWLGVLVYLTNTYVLMLTSGGQMGLALAYAVAPLVLVGCIRRSTLLLSVSWVAMTIFDLRFSFIMALVCVLYFLFVVPVKEKVSFIKLFLFPALFVFGVHSMWLVPALTFRSFSLPAGYGDIKWLDFLSLAEFSKAISLQHPNWPENIFGKTYFTRAEFLVLPIIAFISFFRKSLLSKTTLFFSFLLLFGAFLAKGTQPPLGGVYQFLFTSIPFFDAFRDPTKFYLIIALSFTYLLPQGLKAIGKVRIAPFAFIVFWIILIAPAVTGKVGGALARNVTPQGFVQLAQHLSSDASFSRTLVVPWKNRYIFESENHPAVDARYLFETSDIPEIIQKLQSPETVTLLKRHAIQYIVLPTDPHAEIFTTDRKYEDTLRLEVATVLDSLPYAQKILTFDGIELYKVKGIVSKVLGGSITQIDPTRYLVERSRERSSEIIFSERFSPHWVLFDGEKEFGSSKTSDGLNSFYVTSDKNILELYYRPQQAVEKWRNVTIATFIMLIVFIASRFLPNKRKLLFMLGFIFFLVVMDKPFGRNTNINWSHDWRAQKTHLFNTATRTRHGGAEFVFGTKGAKQVKVTTKTARFEEGTMVRFWVNDTKVNPELKITNGLQIYSIDNVPQNAKLRAQSVCSGEPDCELMVYTIEAVGGKIVTLQREQKTYISVIGDSISTMYGADNYSYLLAEKNDYLLGNRAINKSTLTEPGVISVQTRIGEFIQEHPDILVMQIGTNDLLSHVSIENFTDQYQNVLHELTKYSPYTKIIILSIFESPLLPVDKVRQYNASIRSLADGNKIFYVDITNLLVAEEFTDGLHPTKDAHQKIADTIAKQL